MRQVGYFFLIGWPYIVVSLPVVRRLAALHPFFIYIYSIKPHSLFGIALRCVPLVCYVLCSMD